MLKLALAQMQVQMESCQDAGLVVAVFPGMPSFRANSVAPSVRSPQVAGKTTHLAFILVYVLIFCPYFVLLCHHEPHLSFPKIISRGGEGESVSRG